MRDGCVQRNVLRHRWVLCVCIGAIGLLAGITGCGPVEPTSDYAAQRAVMDTWLHAGQHELTASWGQPDLVTNDVEYDRCLHYYAIPGKPYLNRYGTDAFTIDSSAWGWEFTFSLDRTGEIRAFEITAGPPVRGQ